jgi:hypothetical protein
MKKVMFLLIISLSLAMNIYRENGKEYLKLENAKITLSEFTRIGLNQVLVDYDRMSQSTIGTSDFIAYLTPVEIDGKLDYLNTYILWKNKFYLGFKSEKHMIVLNQKEINQFKDILNPKPNYWLGNIIGLTGIILIGINFL